MSRMRPVGIEVSIKLLSTLPHNPTHLDFGGVAQRLLVKTVTSKKKTEKLLESFFHAIRVAVFYPDTW